MLSRITKALWGDLSINEYKKFGVLAVTFALIVGNYATIRSLKNGLLESLVGFEWQPYVKMFSVFATIFIVLAYGKLVDMFEKQKLFYILCPFYGTLFLIISYFAAYPDVLTISPTSAFYPLISWIPGKAIGWISYVTIESSSLVIALFWAFVASTTKIESAKKGYPFIFFIGEIGAIAGPYLALKYIFKIGAPAFLAIGGVLILLVPFFIKFYMSNIPLEDRISGEPESHKKVKTGFLEGIKLILTNPYVLGIFVVTTFYEIVGTILEFQMNIIAAKEVYLVRDAMIAFNARYLIGIGILAMVFALFGSSFFMRRFGLRFCLVSYPLVIVFLVSSAFVSKFFIGITNYQFMWLIFGSMILIKGLSYALNNPSKEVMYIPTSKDVRFKSKSWIEVFGGRSTKSIGAGVSATFSKSLPDLLMYGSIISLGVLSIWIVIAFFVGNTFNKLQKENRIIE